MGAAAPIFLIYKIAMRENGILLSRCDRQTLCLEISTDCSSRES